VVRLREGVRSERATLGLRLGYVRHNARIRCILYLSAEADTNARECAAEGSAVVWTGCRTFAIACDGRGPNDALARCIGVEPLSFETVS